MNDEILNSFLLSLKLAFIVTSLLLLFLTPLAWWLATSKSKWVPFVKSISCLPMVVPPTVLGFYLLLAFGPEGSIGAFTSLFGIDSIAFSFEGLVFASLIYSLPFVLWPLQNSFAGIDRKLLEAAESLGIKKTKTFFKVILPLAKTGYLSAAVLGLTHTLGEFGIVLMIGGSIPGETKVLSISLYEYVEALDYQNAHMVSLLLIAFSFISLLCLHFIGQNSFSMGAKR